MEPEKKPSNFIRDIVDQDIANGKNGGRVHTRFPPEPNGYLHIGHAKAICISFGIARDYQGLCNLRFDDTNPEKEEVEYVDSIREDVHWLGFDWGDREYYASDYFGQLYQHALTLIKKGKAYVCDLSADEQRQHRGTLIAPGKPSPNRERSVEENLELFERMRKGEFPDGTRVLRAKIDMTSPNITMRDPTMYRIKKASHHRTGDAWCIYPMYDFTHCVSDSIEGITHSLCTLEFENNRPLYDWFLIELGIHRPQQIEFARLNLTHTVLSKRILLKLVQQKTVSGWNDPRMPTISGFRRRGYTPSSIRTFCDRIGVAKFNSTIDMVILENSIREELNKTAPRMMAVLKPIKVIITNYPEGKTEELEAVNNPEDPSAGTRKVPFGRELYIEQDDFREVPPPKYFRLALGQEVRLRYAYFIKCEKVIKDPATGEVKEVHCTYDPATRGGNNPPDGRKVKGTIHWVSAEHAFKTEVRLYDHLFAAKDPSDFPEGKDIFVNLNPHSLEILREARLEPALGQFKAGERVQFERLGYFFVDPIDSKPGQPVFNRTVTLRDTWEKIEKVRK
ncbi:MAG: glutamine--tRNA ligase/YqeY domain fusion protein [Candidatus Omnitrophota bacterium]